MSLEFLPPELQQAAEVIKRHHEALKYRVSIDSPAWQGASYRTTLTCEKRGDYELMEVRSDVRVEPAFEVFVRETIQHRRPALIFLAVPHVASAAQPVTQMSLISDLGLGILSVNMTGVNIHQPAVDCATRYEPDPRLDTGKYSAKVRAACRKCNAGQPLDALRDITEYFEDAVRELARKAVSKQQLSVTTAEVEDMELERLINCLAQNEYHSRAQTRLIDEATKRDFLAFKETRNLGHHPRTRAQERLLRRQYIERMEMGVRLIADLVALRRRI